MMVLIFAAMLLALFCAYFRYPRLAVVALLACLAFSTAMFLFEIYSPDYGFRMPWLQVEFRHAPVPAGDLT